MLQFKCIPFFIIAIVSFGAQNATKPAKQLNFVNQTMTEMCINAKKRLPQEEILKRQFEKTDMREIPE